MRRSEREAETIEELVRTWRTPRTVYADAELRCMQQPVELLNVRIHDKVLGPCITVRYAEAQWQKFVDSQWRDIDENQAKEILMQRTQEAE